MNILQFSICYSTKSQGLDSDLAEALVRAGHKVSVAALGIYDIADRNEFEYAHGVRVLKVNTPQIQKVSKLKKGLAFLMLPFLLKRCLKKKFRHEKFDLIIFEAPPVTLQSTVKWAMKYFECPSYLMQKDIFPQNAVDLGLIKKGGLPYIYFKRQETAMLNTTSIIGCMSQGNVDYIKKHNPHLGNKTVEIFPNTRNIQPVPQNDRANFRKKHGIPENACVFLYGGNMGIPQQMELMLDAVKHFAADGRVYFIFAGSGTETPKLKNFLTNGGFKNAKFFETLPRDEYNALSVNCDVGLVTLDHRYTIPNYPSKTLSYMECEMPIVAATDIHTDYRDLIEKQAECGLWSDSSNKADFFSNIEKMAASQELRSKFGKNGRKYLEKHFAVERSVKILENHFDNR